MGLNLNSVFWGEDFFYNVNDDGQIPSIATRPLARWAQANEYVSCQVCAPVILAQVKIVFKQEVYKGQNRIQSSKLFSNNKCTKVKIIFKQQLHKGQNHIQTSSHGLSWHLYKNPQVFKQVHQFL